MLIEGGEQRGLARMLGQDGNQVRQVPIAVDLVDASVGLRGDIVLAEQFAAEVDQACVFFVQVRCRLAIADYVDNLGLETILDGRGLIDSPVTGQSSSGTLGFFDQSGQSSTLTAY